MRNNSQLLDANKCSAYSSTWWKLPRLHQSLSPLTLQSAPTCRICGMNKIHAGALYEDMPYFPLPIHNLYHRNHRTVSIIALFYQVEKIPPVNFVISHSPCEKIHIGFHGFAGSADNCQSHIIKEPVISCKKPILIIPVTCLKK